MKIHALNPNHLTPIDSQELRWRCELDTLHDLIQSIIDEERSCREHGDSAQYSAKQTAQLFFASETAIESLRLGVSLDASGYHVYVSGPSGSGKSSSVRRLLETLRRPERERFDFVYLHHFEDPDRPRLCTLPAGQGRALKRRLISFTETLSQLISGALNSTRLEDQRRSIMTRLEVAVSEALVELSEECKTSGFVFHYSEEDFGASEIRVRVNRWTELPLGAWIERVERGKLRGDVEAMSLRHAELTEHLHSLWDELSRLDWELHRHIAQLEVEEITARVMFQGSELLFDAPTEDLEEGAEEGSEAYLEEGSEESSEEGPEDHPATYPKLYARANTQLIAWLKGLTTWIDEHLDELKHASETGLDLRELRILRANLIHEAPKEPPLIYESSPTLINLLGTIERSGEDNHPHLDFGDIRSGSLLKAQGGILVLNANDLSSEDTAAWRCLLRALRSQRLEIQSPDQLFASGGSPIKPDPIPLDVKVIAIGDDEIYRALFMSSEDFGRVFKVKAEFDHSVPNDHRALRSYIHHALTVQREERLKPFSLEALGLWCEYGTRLSGRRDRLSTQLGTLTDLLREAAFYATSSNAHEVTHAHMKRALQQRFERHRLVEHHISQLITDGLIELTPEGREIGVTHGLTVLDFADHVCGVPCRVSATHAPGELGVVSVERESRLSGRSHDKGAIHVSAYLRARYLPDDMCALSATLSFDQTHDEVDGDSASLAELIALISSLSQRPVNQSLALTGAIDQRGHVQAIGGVNEKIEGFFSLCTSRGLNGEQGVIIPRSVIPELSLKQAVIDAVEAEQFRIWGISHVDEAVALLFTKPSLDLNEVALNETVRDVSEAVSRRLSALTTVAARYRRGDV